VLLTFEVKSDLNLDLHKFEMNYICDNQVMQSRVARDFLSLSPSCGRDHKQKIYTILGRIVFIHCMLQIHSLTLQGR
jgi:hypothetical protein